jgi:hypothetical protein
MKFRILSRGGGRVALHEGVEIFNQVHVLHCAAGNELFKRHSGCFADLCVLIYCLIMALRMMSAAQDFRCNRAAQLAAATSAAKKQTRTKASSNPSAVLWASLPTNASSSSANSLSQRMKHGRSKLAELLPAAVCQVGAVAHQLYSRADHASIPAQVATGELEWCAAWALMHNKKFGSKRVKQGKGAMRSGGGRDSMRGEPQGGLCLRKDHSWDSSMTALIEGNGSSLI